MRIQSPVLNPRPLLWSAALAAILSTSVLAADLTQSARDLFAHNQNSVLTINALSKMDMSGSGMPIRIAGLGEAQETSCNGVVLDASGLMVVSYSALNPMETLAGSIQIRMGGEGDEGSEGKASVELSRVQIRSADGTEVPARLVFKDKELDLAFVVPDPKEGEKAPAFTPVTLAVGATAKELDDVILLGRHAKTLGYQPSVTIGHVTAVIGKPRTMYDLSTPAQPGAPIFLPDGRLLGILVSLKGGGGGLMGMAMEQLVLPSAEINKLVDQAKKAAAKKDGKKAEKPSEEKKSDDSK